MNGPGEDLFTLYSNDGRRKARGEGESNLPSEAREVSTHSKHKEADPMKCKTTQTKKNERYLFFSQASDDLGENLVRSHSNLVRSRPMD